MGNGVDFKALAVDLRKQLGASEAKKSELLEALEDLVRINEQHDQAIESVTGKPAGWKDDYLNRARAAIAKARGES